MAGPLSRILFTPDLLSKASVQAFDCGSAEWEQEINTWLKASPGGGGALDDAGSGGGLVWLYVTEQNDIAGVGAIAPAMASWPKNSSPMQPATCITWLAVDIRHRRKGYGQMILDDLLNEAKAQAGERQLVVLYVHADNHSARDWYANETNRFVPIGQPRQINGRMYQRMVLRLTPSV